MSGLVIFTRESDRNTNDSKILGCLNVIAKIKTKFYGPMKGKIVSGQSESLKGH